MIEDKDVSMLIIAPEKGGGEGPYYLFAENGEGLASHWCSSSGFARGDLHDNRPERIKEYKEKYGEYKVKFLDESGITEDELLKRNKEHAKVNGYYKE